MEVGDFPAANVGPGDVVIIPAGACQRITNMGGVDLIFYCVCALRAFRLRTIDHWSEG